MFVGLYDATESILTQWVNTPSLIDPARSYRPVEHRRRGHASLVATCPESTLTELMVSKLSGLRVKRL